MAEKHILVVEDDPKVRALLRNCFEADGFAVSECDDGTCVDAALLGSQPDLITLDINLAGDNGLDIARDIRGKYDVPIIMITGKDDVIDRVVGLEMGADDYITKPFHVRELLARVRTVLRRSQGQSRSTEFMAEPPIGGEGKVDLDGLTIDLNQILLHDREGQLCDLTTADFKLLKAFLENPNRQLSRDRLMDLIEGPAWVPLDRTIDNQVARLRRKIERDPSQPRLIKTIRGIGYMLTVAAQPLT
ncbi:MAG: response regulator [Hyphomicrobiales bacterium]|jgi:DNA-binding response OmpR family regulator